MRRAVRKRWARARWGQTTRTVVARWRVTRFLSASFAHAKCYRKLPASVHGGQHAFAYIIVPSSPPTQCPRPARQHKPATPCSTPPAAAYSCPAPCLTGRCGCGPVLACPGTTQNEQQYTGGSSFSPPSSSE